MMAARVRVALEGFFLEEGPVEEEVKTMGLAREGGAHVVLVVG